jgi:hypothetical protein
MAARTIVAIRRQLEREIKHRAWLEQHLQHSVALTRCEQRIKTLEILCAGLDCEQNANAQQKRGEPEPTPIL